MSDIPSASKEAYRTVQGPATAVADHAEKMERLAVLLLDCLGAPDESVDCFLLDVPIAADKAQERRTEIVELLDRWPTETGDGPVSALSAGPATSMWGRYWAASGSPSSCSRSARCWAYGESSLPRTSGSSARRPSRWRGLGS